MMYNAKRAIGISFLLYLTTFIIGIVSGVLSGQEMTSTGSVPDSFWYIGMVSAFVITVLFTLWYFKNRAIVPSAKSGLFFGLTTIAISSVLDLILFSLGNTQEANVDLTEYFSDVRFWIIVALVLAAATAVGAYRGKTK